MSISFRANPVATTVLQTQSQQNNALGLSENGQKVLNKTNVHANAYDLASTVVDSDKRKENLATVAKKHSNDACNVFSDCKYGLHRRPIQKRQYLKR